MFLHHVENIFRFSKIKKFWSKIILTAKMEADKNSVLKWKGFDMKRICCYQVLNYKNVSFDKVICLRKRTLKKIRLQKRKIQCFSLGTQLAKKIPHQPKKYKCSLKQHNKREDAITTYYCLCVTYTKGTSVLLTSMNAHFFRSLIFRTFLPYV